MTKPNNIRIYYQDETLMVIEKPANFQVHTPVDYAKQGKVVRKNNLLILLRKQTGKKIYTIHRLDRATSGVMIFSLTPEGAASMQKRFKDRKIKKTYFCLVRGWTQDSGVIHHPLTKNIGSGNMLECETEYETLYRFEIPHSVGKYPKERYSFVRVRPITGRTHQIRRHFKHLSHPLVGDTVHGDGKHNRLWRELLKKKNGASNYLFLKAYSFEFDHPEDGKNMKFRTRWNRQWLELFDFVGFCPYL